MKQNVKPLSRHGVKVKVHAIDSDFEGIADNGTPYAYTFCFKNAIDWTKTDEKVSCIICLRRGGAR